MSYPNERPESRSSRLPRRLSYRRNHDSYSPSEADQIREEWEDQLEEIAVLKTQLQHTEDVVRCELRCHDNKCKLKCKEMMRSPGSSRGQKRDKTQRERAHVRPFENDRDFDRMPMDTFKGKKKHFRPTPEGRSQRSRFQEEAQKGADSDQVDDWLCTAVKLPQYLELFISEGFEDMDSIETLKEQDLEEMGISKKGHRNKIMRFVKRLRRGERR